MTNIPAFTAQVIVINIVIVFWFLAVVLVRVENFLRFIAMRDLLIQYMLDFMHCKLNVAKNIVKTVTGLKDPVKVRQDLQCRNIRKHLWMTPYAQTYGNMLKPIAPYVMSTKEFDVFANTIESLKSPSGLISNMGQYIRKKKFGRGG